MLDFMYREMLEASIRSKELDYKVKSGSVNMDHKRPVGFLSGFNVGDDNDPSFIEELKDKMSLENVLDIIPPTGMSDVPKLPLLILLDMLFGGDSSDACASQGASPADSTTSSSKHNLFLRLDRQTELPIKA